MHCQRSTWSVAFLLAALILSGCGPSTSAPAPTPAGTAPIPAPAGEEVTIPEIAMVLTIPAGWERQGQSWTWLPPGGPAGQRLGLAWAQRTPGQEPEALFFPANSQVLDRSEGPALSWGTAATYRLMVLVPGGQGQVQAYEEHMLVRDASMWYDLYAVAPTAEELAAIEPVLQQVLARTVVTARE